MSTPLIKSTIEGPDDIYQWLIALHEGLTEAESHLINARLILLLINHIGDREAVRGLISLAQGKRGERKEGGHD